MRADIPPVRIFGIFTAFGIMAAWVLTITFIPAGIMLIDEKRLSESIVPELESKTFLTNFLSKLGNFAYEKAKVVILASVFILGLGIWGVSKLNVNDNPVKWFKQTHPIRQADTAMNRLFGGTYMAYLTVKGETPDRIKEPEVMGYMEKLQDELNSQKLVGKTTSLADIVKRINFILHDKNGEFNVLPANKEEISQYLFLYLMSGSPDDLDNFVDYTYQDANIWVQLKSGENIDMEKIENQVKDFISKNPAPSGIEIQWSGLTYINKIWQDLMVKGMLEAILGSFVVVLVMMIILFKSIRLGFISMIPLTFAIVLSYAMLALIGRDYDMPVAVCSSLALGLAIDFAIHFIQRYRKKQKEGGTKEEINTFMFGETGRAITRNAIVIILGFLPLVFSNLTPYITVGVFFAVLMSASFITTLLLLPGFMRYFSLIFMLLAISPYLAYAEMSADEIIAKSQDVFFSQANDMKANVSMRLVNREGKVRERRLIMLRKNFKSNEQKYFVYFELPQDVRNMTFMVHKLPDKDDLRWLFIPALKMVRRIAASDRRSSFVGSDFTYEDVSGRDTSLDNYKLLKSEKLNGMDCYMVESIPKEEDKFSRKLSWIDEKTFLPHKEEYYNASGELEKVFTAEDVKDIDGFPTIMKRIMKDIKTGHYTEVVFESIKYNMGIEDTLFEERHMQNPPRRYLE